MEETMNTLVLTNPVIAAAQRPAHRDHASLALRSVLDAEIQALKARLSANAAFARGLARADQNGPAGWLRDSLAKLQARRDALS